MMLVSYAWGQKVYAIPYPVKKLVAYLLIVVAAFMMHKGISAYLTNQFWSIGIGLIFITLYLMFLSLIEQKELAKMPVVGKYFSQNKALV